MLSARFRLLQRFLPRFAAPMRADGSKEGRINYESTGFSSYGRALNRACGADAEDLKEALMRGFAERRRD